MEEQVRMGAVQTGQRNEGRVVQLVLRLHLFGMPLNLWEPRSVAPFSLHMMSVAIVGGSPGWGPRVGRTVAALALYRIWVVSRFGPALSFQYCSARLAILHLDLGLHPGAVLSR